MVVNIFMYMNERSFSYYDPINHTWIDNGDGIRLLPSNGTTYTVGIDPIDLSIGLTNSHTVMLHTSTGTYTNYRPGERSPYNYFQGYYDVVREKKVSIEPTLVIKKFVL